MKTHRIVSVVLCIVMGFALTAFAARVANAPNPTGLVVSNVTPDSITIDWTSGGGTTDGFIVAYLEGDTLPAEQCLTGTQVNVGTDTSFVLNNLAAGTTVSFRVCAYNSKGQRSTGITVQGTTEGSTPGVAGISWQPDAVETSEGGQADSISVVLDSQPCSNVEILVASSDEAEAVVSTDTLVFTDQNWSQAQTVMVTGVDDAAIDGSVDYSIDLMVNPLATEDPAYAALELISIPGQNADNDGDLVFVSEDTPKAILDRKTTTSSIHVSSEAELIGAFELNVSLTHQKISDLTISLIGPSKTVPLTYDGASNNWVLTDLSGFNGEILNGTWTLSIRDGVRKNTGTLYGWTMTVTPFEREFTYAITAKGTFLKAQVYRYGKGVQPALMFVHGGGFLINNRFEVESHVLIGPLLESGYTIISVDYRLVPHCVAELAIQDLKDAYSWIQLEGPALFGVDPAKVGIYGMSSGGFLTQLLGYQIQPAPPVRVSCSGFGTITTPEKIEPSQYYIDNYDPVSEADAWDGLEPLDSEPVDGSANFMERFEFNVYARQNGLWCNLVTGFDPVEDRAIYDQRYCSECNVTAQYPPTVLLHGTGDTTVSYDYSVAMAQELASHSVDYDFITVDGGDHGFTNIPEEDIQVIAAQVIIFLDGYLR